MPTVQFSSHHILTFRQGTLYVGVFIQGWTTSEGGTGSNARNCALAFWDENAINSVLNGMVVDSVKLIVQGTGEYGTSNNIGFYLYKSPYKYSASNSSRLSPNDFYPNGTFVKSDGTMESGYIQTTAMSRASSANYTTSLSVDFLDAVRQGYGLMAYRRTQANAPTSAHYTRETNNPLIQEVTYHAPTSDFTLNKSTVDAGQSITVTVTPSDSSYSHRVTWKLNDTYKQTNTIAAGSTQNTYTIPLNWCNALPNATSGTCTCVVETLSGTTVMGSKTKNFTMTVPSSVKPTITSLTASGVNLQWGLYVQGKSKATFTINGAAGAYGSTITGYSITGGGYSGSTNPYTTAGTLNTAGSITFTATVTDSRGRTSTAQTATITVMAYSAPVITAIKVERCSDTGGTLNDEGKYCKCTMNYTWSAIGSNTRTTAVHYRETGAGTWQTGTTSLISSGGFAVIGSGNTFAIDKSYEIRFTLDDDISSPTYAYATLQTAEYIMDFRAGGKGVAFGKVAQADNCVEINPDWQLKCGTINNSVALAVDKGGTGATNAAQARTNLGITLANLGAAASSHNHDAGNITSGTLSAARGGTGQTSLQATRNAMGLGNTTGALPIANGGTGSTTAANAIQALGIITGSGTASSSATDISYGVTFSAVPKVFATWSKTGGAVSGDWGTLKVYNKTTTGFTIAAGGSSPSSAQAFDWVAIGPR